jgi:pimeloyl-ACP methyl ester carboxylesterase
MFEYLQNYLLSNLVFNYHVYKNKDELHKRAKITNFLETDRNYKIPYLFIKNSEQDQQGQQDQEIGQEQDQIKNKKKLIIYSHGNSYDIYMSYNRMKMISNALNVDVLIYDYCGFGAHQLESNSIKIAPNEENICKDLSDIIDFTIELGYSQEDSEIYLMGHSLGTGPSIKLASEKQITGLIVASGFTSVFAVALGTNFPFINGLDIFNNAENIKNVSCKVLILHGTDDDVIPLEHAKILIDNSNDAYFYIEERGDHNTLSINMIKAIKEFIE